MKQTQTNNQIKKEHLLNFVVNTLDEGLPIDLGEDIDIPTEDLYEIEKGQYVRKADVDEEERSRISRG